MRTRFVSAALAAMFSVVMVACKGATDVDVNVTQIVIVDSDTTSNGCVMNGTITGTGLSVTSSGSTVNMQEGTSLDVTATFTGPPSCVTNDEVDWSSSNENVATVTKTGPSTATIFAVNPGQTIICATDRETGARVCFTLNVTGVGGQTSIVVNPTSIVGSNGTGCPNTFSLQVTVTGVTNPVISVTAPNGNGIVGNITNSGSTWTGTIVGAGTTTLTVAVAGHPELTRQIPVSITNNACVAQPTVTNIQLIPSSDIINVGDTRTCTVIISYNNGTSVTGTAAQGLFTLVSSNGNVSVPNSSVCEYRGVAVGNATLTATALNANGTPTTQTANMGVEVRAAVPTGNVTFNPASICLSLVGGTTTTTQLFISSGASFDLSDVTFEVSNPGVTVSLSGNILTVTRTATAAANGDIRVMVNGTNVGSLPWSVRIDACPGSSSSIDYSPPGGTVSGTQTLDATCVQGADISEACEPFWTSNHPEILAVRGNNTRVVNGITFHVGDTATITRVSNTPAGVTVEIAVQWSISRTTPRRVYFWQ